MTISLSTRKMLWGRSGNKCAFPDCKSELIMEDITINDSTIIGEECHIVGEKLTSPRGNHGLPLEDRGNYSNLILLCHNHHKIIDDQVNTYTVEILNKIKSEHEEWFKNTNGFDEQKQKDDEIYCSYIQEWSEIMDLDNWKSWSSYVLSAGEPKLSHSMYLNIEKCKTYLLSRVWPKRYNDLEDSFNNFLLILNDFYFLFNIHLEEVGVGQNKSYWVKKFYKIGEWDEEKYNLLLKEYNFHVDLVQDLMLELTRAANYICDKVRQYILPNYRIKEGVLLVESGPYSDLTYQILRLEYKQDERASKPYHGLEKFKELRKFRDFHFCE